MNVMMSPALLFVIAILMQCIPLHAYSQDPWQELPSGTRKKLRDISFTDRQNGWACGAGATLIRTMNGGMSWAPVAFHTIDTTGVTFMRVRMFEDQTGYLLAWQSSLQSDSNGSYLFKTIDGGSTWGIILRTGESDSTLIEFSDISFATSRHGTLISNHPVLGRSYLHYTSDGGANWHTRRLYFPLAITNQDSFPTRGLTTTCHMADTVHGFVGGTWFPELPYEDREASVIFRTNRDSAEIHVRFDDGREAPTYITSDICSTPSGDVFVINPLLYGITAGYKRRTPHTGNDRELNALACVSDSLIFASLGDSVLRTTNGGTTWRSSHVGPGFNAMAAVEGSAVYGAGDSGRIMKLELATVGVESMPEQTSGVSLAYYAAEDAIIVHLPNTLQHDRCEIVLYDITGMVITRQPVTSPSVRIDARRLGSGHYFLRLREGSVWHMPAGITVVR